MIIVETCPKCGHDLQDLVLTTNPPIPKKKCFNCGWSWTGTPEPEEIVRVPFGGNSLIVDDLVCICNDYLSNDNFENCAVSTVDSKISAHSIGVNADGQIYIVND